MKDFSIDETKEAVLVNGDAFHRWITEGLADRAEGKADYYGSEQRNITAIRWCGDAPPDGAKAYEAQEAGVPVYVWMDGGDLCLASTAKRVLLNPDSAKMFSEISNLEDISGLSHLDAGEVRDMREMFMSCGDLGDFSPIAGWDVSKVENMSYAFGNCYELKDTSAFARWRVDKVTNMDGLFFSSGVRDLTGLRDWGTKKVTRMNCMFTACRDLKTLKGLEEWNVSSVARAEFMFGNCVRLRDLEPIKGWRWRREGVSRADMFDGCCELDNLSAIKAWGVEDRCEILNMLGLDEHYLGVLNTKPRKKKGKSR